MKPEELGQILVRMGESGETAAALWDVLTALRGPDNGDADVKRATTEVIRWHLLGKNPAMRAFSGSFCGADSVGEMHMRVYLSQNAHTSGLGHFIAHARRAFSALGLKWSEVNT